MEDFRDKLKSVRQFKNFDNWNDEEMWNEIDLRLPKKRKRRILFWLLGGVFLLCFGFTIIHLIGEEHEAIVRQGPMEKETLLNQEISNDEHAIVNNGSFDKLIPKPEGSKNIHDRDDAASSSADVTTYVINDKVLALSDNVTPSFDEDGTVVIKKAAKISSVSEEEVSFYKGATNFMTSDVISPVTEHLIIKPVLSVNDQLSASVQLNLKTSFKTHLEGIDRTPVLISENSKDEKYEGAIIRIDNDVEERFSPSLVRKEQILDIYKLPSLIDLILLPDFEDQLQKFTHRAKNKTYPFVFSVSGGLGAFRKKVNPTNQELIGLADFREVLEAPEESAFINIRVDKQVLRWGLGIYGGLTYNQYNERVYHQYSSISELEVFSPMAFFIRERDGTRFFVPGNAVEITEIAGELGRNNETRFLKIPIGITIQKNISQFTVSAHVGTALNIYNQANGEIVLLDNQLIAKADFGSIERIPLKLSTFQAGIKARYNVFRKVGLFASINYDADFISIQGKNNMKEKFQMVNVGFGLSLEFN